MSITNSPKVQITLSAACAHVEALRGNVSAVMSFRVVPETAAAKERFKELAQKPRMNFRGTIGELFDTLKARNEKGWAVYYVLNETDGKGTTKKHVTKVVALPLDLDGAPLPKKWLGDLVPHIVLESSPGKYQCIFLIEPTTDFDAAKAMAQRVAKAYGGDPSVCDAPRILRLAGFRHQKGDAFISRIVQTNEFEPQYKLKQFDAVLPRMPKVDSSSESPSGVGTVNVDAARLLLEDLDPADAIPDNEAWERLAMSLHAASDGDDDVKEYFLEWCQRDPEYSDQANYDNNAYRYETFDSNKEGGRGAGTLRHMLREHGVSESALHAVFTASSASDDFDDDMTFESDDAPDDMNFNTPADDDDDGVKPEGLPPESLSKLEEINEKYCAVYNAGNYRIMFSERHAGGIRWATSGRQDFENYFMNQMIERDMTGLSRNAQSIIALGEAWQKWPRRRTAHGTCFNTKAEPGAIVNGALNLWSGFAVEPKEGDWSRFERMIRDDICAGESKVFDYVIRWTAWKFQNPGLLPEVAVAFKGGKGAGKTTFGETIANTFGTHGMCTASVDDIVGRFNAMRETKCFIYADEAVWGGDKRSESELKKLITDPTADYEAKGQNSFQGVNHVGLMLGGNDKWIVPASMDERRFCVTTVSTEHYAPPEALATDPNRLYWNKIRHELANGGRAAFLHAMLACDLDGWHPRIGVPHTVAMGEQKLHGLTGADRWWFERLRDCDIPFDAIIDRPDEADSSIWRTQPIALKPAEMTKSFAAWTATVNRYTNISERGLLESLRAWGVEGGNGVKVKQVRCWKAPRLEYARQMMAERLGFDPFTG